MLGTELAERPEETEDKKGEGVATFKATRRLKPQAQKIKAAQTSNKSKTI
jgi:hypothetical protein